jgi:hypothetical protein
MTVMTIISVIPANCLRVSERDLWLDSMDIVMHEIVTSFLYWQLIKRYESYTNQL